MDKREKREVDIKFKKMQDRYEQAQVYAFSMFTDEFRNLALSIFKWKLVDDKYTNMMLNDRIEQLLYETGMVTIFRDKKDGVVKVGNVGGSIKYNYLMIPQKWGAVFPNGEMVNDVTIDNGVIIYNNKTHTPTQAYADYVASKMVATDVTIDQQLIAHRVPFTFTGEENDMLTFKLAYEKISGGVPVIYLDNAKLSNDKSVFNVFNSDIEYKADKLMDLFDKYENRFLKAIGLQSNYIEKKAQQNEEEINKNDDIILVNFASYKEEREHAIEILKNIVGFESVSLEVNEFLTLQRGEKNGNREDKKKEEDEL